MACPSYFIVHSLLTRDALTYTKLKWLVHHILLFTVCAHVMLQRKQILTSVGSLRLTPTTTADLSSKLKAQVIFHFRWPLCLLYNIPYSPPFILKPTFKSNGSRVIRIVFLWEYVLESATDSASSSENSSPAEWWWLVMSSSNHSHSHITITPWGGKFKLVFSWNLLSSY